MKKYKTLIITLIIVAAVALLIANLDKATAAVKKVIPFRKADPAGAGAVDTGNTSQPVNMNLTLYRDMPSGNENEVKDLQRMLNHFGHGLVVDGVFGPKTQAALKAHTGMYSITLTDFVNNYYNNLK